MLYNRNKLVYSVVALFTIAQIIIIMVFGPTPYFDSETYYHIALDCLEKGEPYPVTSELKDIPFVWNIGSIDITALFLYIFHSKMPLLYFYAVLKGLSALLVYKITFRLFGDRTALFALFIYVLYPANYGESTSLLSELPFVFFILLGIWLALRSHAVAGGLFIGLANWFRPMGLVFIATMTVYFLFVRKWRNAVKIISGFALIIIIFGTLSWLRTGYFLYQAKSGWMALLQYSVDTSPDDDAYYMNTNVGNAVQRDSVWQRRMVEWTLSHPTEYVSQMPLKLAKTFVSDNANFCAFLPDKNTAEYIYGEVSMETLIKSFPHYNWVQWLTVVNLVYYYILLILFVLGCVSLLRYKHYSEFLLPFGTVFFGTAILLFFGHGEARFHIPFMPFIIMIGAYWLQNIVSQRVENTLLNGETQSFTYNFKLKADEK